MHYDLNIKESFGDFEDLENSEAKGFCMAFQSDSNFRGISQPVLPTLRKPLYSRIDLDYQNRLDQSAMAHLQRFNIVCLRNVDSTNISSVIKLDPDLISLRIEGLRHIKKSLVNVLKQKGIYVEMVLRDALYSSKERVVWMNSLRRLLKLGCAKNLVISSGASIFTELKRSHDICKLLNLFGLSDDNARRVLLNSEAVLRKAAMKRYSFKNSVATSADEGSFKHDFILNYHKSG
jgi:RNase P/RNase MRP subunit p30